ncbi:MAG: hypothetical protein QF664_01630 [Dehalococcoidia bacterium]|nr:hypothetical protein [Dehalococcoidia bacterium]
MPAIVKQTEWRAVEADIRLLCMHQGVEGAHVAGYTFRSGSDVARPSDVPPQFAAVLAGHIHRAQVLAHDHPCGPPPAIYPGSTERTLFAERGDAKGFTELSFASVAPDAPGDRAWRMRQARLIALPARPMVDLELDATLPPSELRDRLVADSANFDGDAVVRIRCRGDARSSLGAALTASFLRSVFPSTMNVQLGAEFLPERRRRSRRARS